MGTALVVWREHRINRRKKPKPTRTICEVLRELYRHAETHDDKLSMALVDEAHDMAKRMHRRMLELNPSEPYMVSEKK